MSIPISRKDLGDRLSNVLPPAPRNTSESTNQKLQVPSIYGLHFGIDVGLVHGSGSPGSWLLSL